MQTHSPRANLGAWIGRAARAAALIIAFILFAAPAYAERALPVAGRPATQPGATHAPLTGSTLFFPVVRRQHPLAKLAFESDRDGNAEIYVMESDGTSQTRLTFNAADDYAPAWSPDSTRIAFTSKRDGGFDIYVMNADGSNQVRLTTTSADSWPSWSPDGSQIVFQTFRDGNGEIYVMNANGSNQTRLTFDPANDFYARWSPDGARIAFFSQRSPSGIFVMQANGSGVTPLVAGDEPDWSADGTRIAFLYGTGIYVAEADGSGATFIAGYMLQDRWPRWHP
jgi:Tol biopolymer transport system component